MDPIDVGGLVSLVLSLVCIPLLLLVFIPHCLPHRWTSIPQNVQLSGSSISILITTIIFAAQAIFDLVAQHKTGSTACAVDAILETYFKTALIAHLPVLALSNSNSIPSPSRPDPSPPSKRKVAILLFSVYIYATFPIIPTITTAASLNFKLDEGFGKWWGIYCIDRSSWWRIVRPITLLPPLLFTAILSIGAISSLYSNTGHPSFKIYPSKRQWATTVYMLICAVGGISYLIVEQMIGWVWNWWPRTFESSLCLLVFIPYACNREVWRPYTFWIRLKRPIAVSSELPTTTGPPTGLVPRDASTARRKATSSFFADAVPWTSLFPRPSTRRPVPGRLITTQPTISQDTTLSTIGGSSTLSPPFVYSVAQTMQTNTIHTSDTQISSEPQAGPSISNYTTSSNSTTRAPPTLPTQSKDSQLAPNLARSPLRLIPPPLVLRPATHLSPTGSTSSVYSTESALESGVASVFATRHSRGSSLPKIYTPSVRFLHLHRDRLIDRQRGRADVASVEGEGEVVFVGSETNPYTGIVSPDRIHHHHHAEVGRVEAEGQPGQLGQGGPGRLTPPKKAFLPDSPASWGSRGTFGRISKSRGGQI